MIQRGLRNAVGRQIGGREERDLAVIVVMIMTLVVVRGVLLMEVEKRLRRWLLRKRLKRLRLLILRIALHEWRDRESRRNGLAKSTRRIVHLPDARARDAMMVLALRRIGLEGRHSRETRRCCCPY